jgi:hypothetical protein
MKTHKQIFSLIFTSFLVLNFSISTLQVTVSTVWGPDQFIAEIFPNCTLPLQLSHTSTLIIINATEFPNKFSIQFDANYTIRNTENTTTIPLVVLFSLAIDIADLAFEVHANNNQIPYDLFSTTTWDENITAIDIYWLPSWIDLPAFYDNPITFIKTNVTLYRNSTSVIRYQIRCPMNNFFDSKESVYFSYYLGTSKEWIGNTTGIFEYLVYGKEPAYHQRGGSSFNGWDVTYTNIVDEVSLLFEWNNAWLPDGDIGFTFNREVSILERIMQFMPYFLFSIAILIVIIIVVLLRKKQKKVVVL